MTAFLGMLVLLAAGVSGAARASEAADKDEIKLVEYVTRTDTSELNPALIPPFMKINPEALPGKLRMPYEAKRDELEVLAKLAEGRKKPPIRRAGQEPMETCMREKKPKKYVDMLTGMMGFFEIYEDEVEFLQKKTNCSFCELAEEFSFTPILQLPEKKKEKPKKRYLLHIKDPLEAYVGQYRKSGGAKSGTNFFATGFMGACR